MKKIETCSYISHWSESDENAIVYEIACDVVKRANVVVGLRKEIFAKTHTDTHKPTSAHDQHLTETTLTHIHLKIVCGAPRSTAWWANKCYAQWQYNCMSFFVFFSRGIKAAHLCTSVEINWILNCALSRGRMVRESIVPLVKCDLQESSAHSLKNFKFLDLILCEAIDRFWSMATQVHSNLIFW